MSMRAQSSSNFYRQDFDRVVRLFVLVGLDTFDFVNDVESSCRPSEDSMLVVEPGLNGVVGLGIET